jgi:CheY-like chemotaxis protein
MPKTVVLAVGLDSSLLAVRDSVWRSAGYHVTPARSIREAIAHLRDCDFDLILLGNSLPRESRERLAYVARATRSSLPVVSITESSNDHDHFADATIRNEPDDLLHGIGELLAKRVGMPAANMAIPRGTS